ncbi:hypothetical protein F2P81_014231 [Scophthalmus maximus]|uniref:Uncharacterized protein n=1 Tax=Scophthalmus maximus TaxID=52904 RepID=A0A6A4SNN6_SCOMX|nr:hypothetical protein F2P81_014231 [Scophthalmus maximus]
MRNKDSREEWDERREDEYLEEGQKVKSQSSQHYSSVVNSSANVFETSAAASPNYKRLSRNARFNSGGVLQTD